MVDDLPRGTIQNRQERIVRTATAYMGFFVLAVIATYPAWRIALFGFAAEDYLQLRCLSP
jgi:hypothetical protein